MSPAPRLLFVHAHPDDETITCGGTMAKYAAAGFRVTVVTCTRGELGEVIGDDLAHLQADDTEAGRTASGNAGDKLATYRQGELADAMTALGVTDQRFLGDVGDGGELPPRRFRDSGMAWGPDGQAVAPSDMNAEALCRAGIDEAAAYLANIMVELQPHVVVTYNKDGGYGHPDHVRTHDVTFAALDKSASAGFRPAKVYEIETPATELRRSFDSTQPGFAATGFDPAGSIPTVPTPDKDVTTAIDISTYFDAKLAGLHAHATQVEVSGEFMALSNGVGSRVLKTEYYRLVLTRDGSPAADPPDPRETDLLAESGADGVRADGVRAWKDAPETVPMRRGAGGRGRMIAGYAFAVIVGALTALLGTVDHQLYVMAGSQLIAMGLIVALVTVALVQLALGLWSRRVGPAIVVGALCFLAATTFGQSGPGGSILIPGNLRGIFWTVGPVVETFIMAFVLVKFLPAGRRVPRQAAQSPQPR